MDKSKKKIYIYIIIFIIFFSLSSAVLVSIFSNKNKKNSNSDYIYEDKIPIINVDNNDAQNANQVIENLYENATNDPNINLNHNIYKNSNVYSLVIEKNEYSSYDETYVSTYTIYNIDVNDGAILNKEELLEKYGYTKDEVVASALTLLTKYYNDEVDIGYVEANECNLDCYITSLRGIEDIYNNIELYVQDNILKGYITYSPNSYIDDKEYFESSNNNYQFEVTK